MCSSDLQLCEARPPSAYEKARLVKFLQQESVEFKSDTSAAEKLIAIGSAEHAKDLDPVQLAAWTMTANVLLNLDETLNKE